MPWPKPTLSATRRGYGVEHQKLRARLLPSAYGTACARCHRPMLPGQELHLDHTDDKRGYLGFSHAECNIKAGNAKGRRMAKLKYYEPKRVRKLAGVHRW